jgi:hypothetical protein
MMFAHMTRNMVSNDFEGICLMTTAACTNHQGLYVQRFFLGALESGVSPAWMLVVGGKSSPYHVEHPDMNGPLIQPCRMVQETRTSLPHGRVVLDDWLCEHRFSPHKLWTRTHHWVSFSLALYVSCRWQHYDTLGFRDFVLHAS